MKLSVLIQLQEGAEFSFRGRPAIVVKTQFERELIERNEERKEFWRNNFNLFFRHWPIVGCSDYQEITLYSGHPHPPVLELKEFDDSLGWITNSSPPQMDISCPSCGFKGRRFE